MRLVSCSAKTGAAVITVIIVTLSLVKYSIDMSYIELGQLNNQLLDLRNRYNLCFVIWFQIVPHFYTFRYGRLVGRISESFADDNSSCSPFTKVAFAKTHKTGSSTLQNILFR